AADQHGGGPRRQLGAFPALPRIRRAVRVHPRPGGHHGVKRAFNRGMTATWVAAACLALLAACATKKAPDAPLTVRFEPVPFSKLPGWRTDDALAAWPAIVSSCGVLGRRAEWQSFCGAVAATSPGDAEFVR